MILIDHVSKVYAGDIVALRDVTFQIENGEFLFLVGPSGAGKSTLIRLLIREELPTDGTIVFDETDITRIGKPYIPFYRQQIGVVFQDYKLIDIKTIRENIEFALEITGKSDDEIEDTSQSLLELVGLQDRQNLFPNQLSGGEKQRAGIARALANEPKLLIADEPTGNLDPVTSAEIMNILETVNSWGTTVLISTHDKNVVDKMKKRVVRLECGALAADRVGGYDTGDKDNPTEVVKISSPKNKATSDRKVSDTPKDSEKSQLEVEMKGSSMNVYEVDSEEAQPLELLNLPTRTLLHLKKNGFSSIDELLDLSEEDIIDLKGIGEKKAQEIIDALALYLSNTSNGQES